MTHWQKTADQRRTPTMSADRGSADDRGEQIDAELHESLRVEPVVNQPAVALGSD
jgi:hypothetical protein